MSVALASSGPSAYWYLTRSTGSVALVLGRAGLQIKGLTMRTPTLDDVFMAMTGSRIEEGEAIP